MSTSVRITIDTETDSLDARVANLVTCQVTCDGGTLLITPDEQDKVAYLKSLWVNPNIGKTLHNGGYDIKVLERFLGERIQGYYWDTILAEHLLFEETHYNLELLRGIYTAQPVYERELRRFKDEKVTIPNGFKTKKVKVKVPNGLTKKGTPKFKTEVHEESIEQFKTVKRIETMHGYKEVPPSILYPYGVYDSQTEHMVMRKQEKLLSAKQKQLLQEVVLPMQYALTEMERDGILVDVARVPEVRQYYIEESERLKQKIFEAADSEFKVSSPLEVRKVLYEELGLPQPPVKSKKTGEVSTGKRALDWLSSHIEHPVIKALEEWRECDQLLRMFLGKPNKNGEILKGLMSHVAEDDRFHTTFRMTLETGRNSSSPNLQNLPKNSKGPMRELLIAEPGNVLLQPDYSMVELRIAAYESGDTYLIDLLEGGGDVHTIFARRLFPFDTGLSDDEWKKKHDGYRTLAKRFTFGRLFGQGEQGMALTFNISTDEALRFQAVYADLFPGMAAWWNKVINQVRSGQPLETVFGRQRRFPAFTKFRDIYWRGKNGLLAHLEREALNFIPQGTAADFLNKATGNLHKLIMKYNLPMALRLVVHDSITLEVLEVQVMKMARIIKAEMESVGNEFGMKLPVEFKYGRNWSGELGELKV